MGWIRFCIADFVYDIKYASLMPKRPCVVEKRLLRVVCLATTPVGWAPHHNVENRAGPSRRTYERERKGRNSLGCHRRKQDVQVCTVTLRRRVTITTQRCVRRSGVALAVAVLAGGEPGKGFELAAERAVVGVAAAQGNFGDRQFAG